MEPNLPLEMNPATFANLKRNKHPCIHIRTCETNDIDRNAMSTLPFGMR